MEEKLNSPPYRGGRGGRPFMASPRNIFSRLRSASSHSPSPRRDDSRKQTHVRRSPHGHSRSRSGSRRRHSPPRRYPGHFRPQRGFPRSRGYGFRGQPYFRGQPPFRGQPSFRGPQVYRGQQPYRGKGGFAPRPRSRSYSAERLRTEMYSPDYRRSSEVIAKDKWDRSLSRERQPERSYSFKDADGGRHSPRKSRSMSQRSNSTSESDRYSHPRHQSAKRRHSGPRAASPRSFSRSLSPEPKVSKSKHKIKPSASAKHKSVKKKVKKSNSDKKLRKSEASGGRINSLSPESLQRPSVVDISLQPRQIPLKTGNSMQEGGMTSYERVGMQDHFDHRDTDYRHSSQQSVADYGYAYSSGTAMYRPAETSYGRPADVGRDSNVQAAVERSNIIPGLELANIRRDFYPDVVIVRRKDEGSKPLFLREEFQGVLDDDAEKRVVKLMPAQQNQMNDDSDDIGSSDKRRENFQVQRPDDLMDGGTAKRTLTERWAYKEHNRVEPSKPADRVDVVRHERSPSPPNKRKTMLARSMDGSQIMGNDIKVGDAVVTKQHMKHEASSPPISAMKRESLSDSPIGVATRKGSETRPLSPGSNEDVRLSHLYPVKNKAVTSYSYSTVQSQRNPAGMQDAIAKKRAHEVEKVTGEKKRMLSSTGMHQSYGDVDERIERQNISSKSRQMVGNKSSVSNVTKQHSTREADGKSVAKQQRSNDVSDEEEEGLRASGVSSSRPSVRGRQDGGGRRVIAQYNEDENKPDEDMKQRKAGGKKSKVVVRHDSGGREERIVIPTNEHEEHMVMTRDYNNDNRPGSMHPRIVLAQDREHSEERPQFEHQRPYFRARGSRGSVFDRNPRDLRYSINRGYNKGFRGFQPRGRGFRGNWQPYNNNSGNRFEKQEFEKEESPLPDFSRRPDKPRIDWQDQPESVPKGRSYFEHDNRESLRGRGRPFYRPRGMMRGSFRGYVPRGLRRGSRPFNRSVSDRSMWRQERNSSPQGDRHGGSDADSMTDK